MPRLAKDWQFPREGQEEFEVRPPQGGAKSNEGSRLRGQAQGRLKIGVEICFLVFPYGLLAFVVEKVLGRSWKDVYKSSGSVLMF